MKLLTAELTGKPLDWALAVALKKRVRYCSIYKAIVFDDCEDNVYLFTHTDPATCMGLIKEYCIQLYPFCTGDIVRWDADIRPDLCIVSCDTPEQAVARCVVHMRLGDSVDVPDELCGVQS